MKIRLPAALFGAALTAALLCGAAAPQKTYQADGPVTCLEIQETASEITLQVKESGPVTVEYTDSKDGQPLYNIRLEEGKLTVERIKQPSDEDTEGPAMIRIDGVRYDNEEKVPLTITLPRQAYEEIAVAVAVGTVDVQGVEAQELAVGAAVGEISIRDVRADALEVGAAVGNLELERVQAERVELGSAVGKVKAKNVQADEVSTGTVLGTVKLDGVQADKVNTGMVMGIIQGKLLGDADEYNISTWGLPRFGKKKQLVPGSEKSVNFASMFGPVTLYFKD